MPTARTPTTGLAKILSSEQFPKRPALRGETSTVEMEKWIEALEIYLRKIYAKLTAENIFTTISQGGLGWELVYDKLVSYSTGLNERQILDNRDWRARMVMADSLHATDATKDTDQWTEGSGQFLGYGVGQGVTSLGDLKIDNGALSGGSYNVYIDQNNGNLVVDIDTSASAELQWIRYMYLGSTRKVTADVTA